MFKPPKTVDGVLLSFTRAIEDLFKIEGMSASIVDDQEEVIFQARNKIEKATKEAERAATIRSRLEAFTFTE